MLTIDSNCSSGYGSNVSDLGQTFVSVDVVNAEQKASEELAIISYIVDEGPYDAFTCREYPCHLERINGFLTSLVAQGQFDLVNQSRVLYIADVMITESLIERLKVTSNIEVSEQVFIQVDLSYKAMQEVNQDILSHHEYVLFTLNEILLGLETSEAPLMKLQNTNTLLDITLSKCIPSPIIFKAILSTIKRDREPFINNILARFATLSSNAVTYYARNIPNEIMLKHLQRLYQEISIRLLSLASINHDVSENKAVSLIMSNHAILFTSPRSHFFLQTKIPEWAHRIFSSDITIIETPPERITDQAVVLPQKFKVRNWITDKLFHVMGYKRPHHWRKTT